MTTSQLPNTHEVRIERARIALEGLSVADALGGFFEFNHRILPRYVSEQKLPPNPWRFTDDTNMALSIYEILRKHQTIDQDALAISFADHFDPLRGYGAGARRLVSRLGKGEYWRDIAHQMFNGKGSFGNGGAMRVAPLGAYFADDLNTAAEQAALSAEITHAHPEGIAGAIAAAVATGIAFQLGINGEKPDRPAFIEMVLPFVPDSEVKSGIKRARDVAPTTSLQNAAAMLGNGSKVSAQDTVPLTLYCAGEYLDDYRQAFWQTASAGGDVDTTCAIVGGIIVSFTGVDNIPSEWIEMREPLPSWALSQ